MTNDISNQGVRIGTDTLLMICVRDTIFMSQNKNFITLSDAPVMILRFELQNEFSILDYSEMGWYFDVFHDAPPKVV